MDRYDLAKDSIGVCMSVFTDGEWAKYDEVEKLEAEIAELKAANKWVEGQEQSTIEAQADEIAELKDKLEYAEKGIDEWRDVALSNQADAIREARDNVFVKQSWAYDAMTEYVKELEKSK